MAGYMGCVKVFLRLLRIQAEIRMADVRDDVRKLCALNHDIVPRLRHLNSLYDES